MTREYIIAAGEFKQKCLALMDEVALEGFELIITKHGTPICKLVSLPASTENSRFGRMKGTIKFHGNLTDPIGEEWEANQK
jgi:prevent-host-death family protein